MVILKFTWKGKGPRIVKTILRKKNKVGNTHFLVSKTYYRVTISRTVWSWHKDKHMAQPE